MGVMINMKQDKKIRITVLEYVRIGNNDTLMYVINGDGDHEFRYVIGTVKPTLKIKSKSPANFFNGLMNVKHLNDLTKKEIIMWFFEISSEYVFPREAYIKFNEEVSKIASSQSI